MNTLDVNMSLAELFVRLFLGIILIFQGYDKLFVVKIKNVVSMFNSDSSKKNVPHSLVVFTSYFNSIIECFVGLLLIIGLFHQEVLILTSISLLIVTTGFSFLNPIWDLKHVFPRVLLVVILFILTNHFYFGLDTIILK